MKQVDFDDRLGPLLRSFSIRSVSGPRPLAWADIGLPLWGEFIPRWAVLSLILLLLLSPTLVADDKLDSQINPFLRTYCSECHRGADAEAKLDLDRFQSLESISKRFVSWREIERRVTDGTMPPKDSPKSPSSEERKAFLMDLQNIRIAETNRLSGDPGFVSSRRLTNAEFDTTIRDLTGVDIQPAREFPVDPANEAGFDNSGESLAMSPSLLKKYLSGARVVASHLVLTPTSIAFAPHPVETDTDRDKYCVHRIVDFYNKQPIDIADYLFVAWKLNVSSPTPTGSDDPKLKQFAIANKISPRYLKMLVESLELSNQEGTHAGPLSEVKQRFQKLPSRADQEEQARSECKVLRDFILNVRTQLEPQFNMRLKGIHDGSQSFVLWKNRQMANHRRRFLPETLEKIDREKLTDEVAKVLEAPNDSEGKRKFVADLELFCSVFPDAFVVSERGRDYLGVPKEKQEKGRLLSAGFHSMMGYFRDDRPLCELILDEEQVAELDRLWQELDYVTAAPLRQYQGFLWFERTDHKFMRDAEFDFARPESKEAMSSEMVQRLSTVYRTKAESIGGAGEQLKAIEDYFNSMDGQIRWVEETRKSTEKIHLVAMERFAEKAFRGAMTDALRMRLREGYRLSKEVDGLTHEEAIQDLLVAVLLSPEFCYRVDLGTTSTDRRALDGIELANRLSYFLWSSMPSERLLELARSGKLKEQTVLKSEVDAMLRDDRIRGLAIEFGSQWLDFRRFREHNSVDREKFPQFTDSLREAMYQEPIRFLLDMIQNDRSVLSCIQGEHTFVNAELAKHYEMDLIEDSKDSDWWLVPNAQRSGRGGLMPMGVFLTQNAPGLRTSPVKRGYWVVRRLLGEKIPPPPPNVPELPSDEAKLGELSLRQTLEQHRKLESCSVCHDRFDSIGLVFENFGPVGERRVKDLGGKPIDVSAVFPNGHEGRGLGDLQAYIARDRQSDFIQNLCRNLLTFALGRTLILSDDILLRQMEENLVADQYRFSSLVRTIVSSTPFLEKRGTED